MNICYLSLGSNQKNSERQIRAAIKSIKVLPKVCVTKISKLYRTKAWGFQNQQDFYNAVIELHTTLEPLHLLDFCQSIEKAQGRVRKKKWGPRVIDIDIILYSAKTIHNNRLVIPHPYFKQRDFVLLPLLEIRPDLKL